MEQLLSRREALQAGVLLAADVALVPTLKKGQAAGKKTRMKLGLITYNVAKDWDLPTIIDHVKKAGWDGVELRTTHAHGVELSLDAPARKEVRQRFADAGVTLWAFGATCEF